MSEKDGYRQVHGFRLSGDFNNLAIKKKPIYNILRFHGDKIEFIDRTVKIKGFTVKEFLDQFDKLVFVDKEGREVPFKKEIK